MSDKHFSLMLSINLQELADELGDMVPPESLVELVMNIDAYVADLSFTRELRDRLNQVIDEEESGL